MQDVMNDIKVIEEDLQNVGQKKGRRNPYLFIKTKMKPKL